MALATTGPLLAPPLIIYGFRLHLGELEAGYTLDWSPVHIWYAFTLKLTTDAKPGQSAV